jgi:uncharacterized lipoprotein YajG
MKRISILLAALALPGCATSEAIEVLNTRYQGSAARLPGAGSLALTVVDARTQNRTMIGQKKNGYGMDMGVIRSNRPVEEVVREHLTGALGARGYSVAAGGPAMRVAVNSFFASFRTGLMSGAAVPDVRLTVTISRPGAADFTRQYDSSGIEVTTMLADGGSVKRALDRGLAAVVDKILADPAVQDALRTA